MIKSSPWTVAEVELLQHLRSTGVKLSDISKKIRNRSIKAIERKIERLNHRDINYESDDTSNDISKLIVDQLRSNDLIGARPIGHLVEGCSGS